MSPSRPREASDNSLFTRTALDCGTPVPLGSWPAPCPAPPDCPLTFAGGCGSGGWLFVPTGLVDGPLPTHYEPAESPITNPLYKQQASPVLKYWARDKSYNRLAPAGDPRYPCVVTTYRLTEHYLSGAMSRWLPWLAELQPELFIEIGRALATERGIANLDWVTITTPRHQIRAKALVTDRIGVMTIGGRKIHHVGLPWHWGWQGLSTGDVVNDLTSWVGDPNVSIHEGKAFVCNVEKA